MKISGIEPGNAQSLPPQPAQVKEGPTFAATLRQVEKAWEASWGNQGQAGSTLPVDQEREALAPLWGVQVPIRVEAVSAVEKPGSVAASAGASSKAASSQPTENRPKTLVDLIRGLVAAFRQARAQGKNFFSALVDTVRYLWSMIRSSPASAETPEPRRVNERA